MHGRNLPPSSNDNYHAFLYLIYHYFHLHQDGQPSGPTNAHALQAAQDFYFVGPDRLGLPSYYR